MTAPHTSRFINTFMNERFNYAGEVKTRREIISEVMNVFTSTDGGKYDKRHGDWFLFCFFQTHNPIGG